MTLPKKYACNYANDILTLKHDEDGTPLDLVFFGEFEFNDRHYLYGMEDSDYDKCFGNPEAKEMIIQFREIFEQEDGSLTYSEAVYFTSEEEKLIFNIIKPTLENVVTSAKHGIN